MISRVDRTGRSERRSAGSGATLAPGREEVGNRSRCSGYYRDSRTNGADPKSDIINRRAVQRDALLLLSAGVVTQAGQAVSGRAQPIASWLRPVRRWSRQSLPSTIPIAVTSTGFRLMPADSVNVLAAWKAIDPELKDLLETREPVTSLYEAVASVNDLSILMLARSDELVEAVGTGFG